MTKYASLLLACLGVLVLVGCSEDKMAEVTGVVTVNGEIPAEGSSINFIPADGKSPSAGATLDKGKYSVRVPLGAMKVELRVPRPRNAAKGNFSKAGPGPGGDWIEESLPPEYNNSTTLTYEVKVGKNEKNWDIQTKQKNN